MLCFVLYPSFLFRLCVLCCDPSIEFTSKGAKLRVRASSIWCQYDINQKAWDVIDMKYVLQLTGLYNSHLKNIIHCRWQIFLKQFWQFSNRSFVRIVGSLIWNVKSYSKNSHWNCFQEYTRLLTWSPQFCILPPDLRISSIWAEHHLLLIPGEFTWLIL